MKNGSLSKIENVEIYKALQSEIRIDILKIILQHSNGIRFNELVEELDIGSTNLEYHLKVLHDSQLINHFEKYYIPNLLTHRLLAEIELFSNELLMESITLIFFLLN